MAKDLPELRLLYRDCVRCGLAQIRSRVVFGHGPLEAELFLLGERPSERDDQTGEPFSGPAGELLRRILAAPKVAIPHGRVYLSNLVLCKTPAGRAPAAAEMEACKQRLIQEIQLVAPEIVVLMGRLPMMQVLGLKGKVEEYRGWQTAPADLPGIQFYVTSNPASARYGSPQAIRDKKWKIYEDWQAIARVYRWHVLASHSGS